MSLTSVTSGSKVKVFGFHRGNRYYKQKLLALGLVPGTEFIIRNLSQLNGMVEIIVHNTSFVLRAAEAEMVKVTKVA